MAMVSERREEGERVETVVAGQTSKALFGQCSHDVCLLLED